MLKKVSQRYKPVYTRVKLIIIIFLKKKKEKTNEKRKFCCLRRKKVVDKGREDASYLCFTGIVPISLQMGKHVILHIIFNVIILSHLNSFSLKLGHS